MSEQTLKKLVGALVVLGALWGVTAFLASDRSGGLTVQGDVAAFFDRLDRNAVDAVTLSADSAEITLTKERGSWKVNGYQTDSTSVARFWSMLEAANVETLIASNPANHARMEITDEVAWRLEVEETGSTRAILIGSEGPRFATVHIRLPGADEVYLLQADIRSHFQRRLDDWRNKRLSRVDTALVARVEIERDGDGYTILRGDSAWAFEDGTPTRPASVSNLMVDLRNVSAAGILAAGDSLAEAEQVAAVTAFSADGQVVHRLTLGAGTGDRWVRAEGDSTVYRLQSFRVDRMFPTRERMAPQADSGN